MKIKYVFYILVAVFMSALMFSLGRSSVKTDNIKTKTEIIRTTDKLPQIISTKPLYFFRTTKEELSGKTIVKKEISVVHDTITNPSISMGLDTISIPISQNVYRGSNYTAYVSGFHQSLDSISVEEKIVTNTIVKKRSRWNLGVSAGYAITPNGFSPYIGVGINYNIFR